MRPLYTEQQLQSRTLSELKTIYTQVGAAVEVTDKRTKSGWVSALVSHQAAQVEEIDSPKSVDDISIEAITPERRNHDDIQFTSPDGFYNWEATVDGKTIATIYYDSEHLTQRYVVAVGGKEVFRWNTQARAERYIKTHYKDGTLPIAEEKPSPCTIEDCKYRDDKGHRYAFRIAGQLIGWIWLTDDGGDWYSSLEYWVNGNGTKYGDWRECGLKLAQLTRNDLYQVVAA